MPNNMKLLPLSPGMSLHSYSLSLRGVRGVTWWEATELGCTFVVLAHSWWTWRGLRDRNRRRVQVKAYDVYPDCTDCEVL